MNKTIIFTDNHDDLLKIYLKEISKYKILDKETLNELILKAQQGDLDSKNKVVQSNLRFVVSIAKQFQNRGISLMDLISEGSIGLMKAVDKYDFEKGSSFISYSVWWIKQYIYNLIYWNGKDIRLPLSQQMLVNSIMQVTTKFLQEHHRNPSSEEISELTNIPVNQIDYLSQFSNKNVSVDDFINNDEDAMQVCDIIPDNSISLDENLNNEYVSEELYKMINTLTIRERDILLMYYGIKMQPVNNKMIADMFGITCERIRQIKEKAIDKIKRIYKNRLNQLT